MVKKKALSTVLAILLLFSMIANVFPLTSLADSPFDVFKTIQDFESLDPGVDVPSTIAQKNSFNLSVNTDRNYTSSGRQSLLCTPKNTYPFVRLYGNVGDFIGEGFRVYTRVSGEKIQISRCSVQLADGTSIVLLQYQMCYDDTWFTVKYADYTSVLSEEQISQIVAVYFLFNISSADNYKNIWFDDLQVINPPMDKEAPVISEFSVSDNGSLATVSWLAQDNFTALSDIISTVYHSTSPITEKILADHRNGHAVSIDIYDTSVASGATSATVQGLYPNSSYYFAVAVTDKAGNVSYALSDLYNTGNYYKTLQGFEDLSADQEVPAEVAAKNSFSLSVNTDTAYVQSGQQSLKCETTYTYPTVRIFADAGEFTGEGFRVFFKTADSSNVQISSCRVGFADGTYITLFQYVMAVNNSWITVDYSKYTSILSPEQIEQVVSVYFLFNISSQANYKTIYLDDLQVINPPRDTQAPALSALTVLPYNDNGASVSWTAEDDKTDAIELKTNVYYGTDPITQDMIVAYDTNNLADTDMAKVPVAAGESEAFVDVLVPETAYYFAVSVTDLWGNTSYSFSDTYTTDISHRTLQGFEDLIAGEAVPSTVAAKNNFSLSINTDSEYVRNGVQSLKCEPTYTYPLLRLYSNAGDFCGDGFRLFFRVSGGSVQISRGDVHLADGTTITLFSYVMCYDNAWFTVKYSDYASKLTEEQIAQITAVSFVFNMSSSANYKTLHVDDLQVMIPNDLLLNVRHDTFDESAYAGVTMNGGSVVRTKDYVRGIAETIDHPDYGYNIPQEIKDIDEQNYKELAISSFRTYTPVTQKALNNFQDKGYSVIWTSGPDTPSDDKLSQYSNGEKYNINWADADTQATYIEKLTTAVKSLTNTTALEMIVMGNEPRWMRQRSDGTWDYTGYDDQTKAAFASWLENRYGTVAYMNQINGWNYDSFSSVPFNNFGTTRLYTESWLFRRDLFQKFMQPAYQAVKNINSNINMSLAKFVGSDPVCDDNYMNYLDYGGQNLYLHDRSFAYYTAALYELCGVSGSRPVYNTESGYPNGANNVYDETISATAARRYKQSISLMYMNPQVQGSYTYMYSGVDREPQEWGITDAYRNKRLSFYGLKQIYNDIRYLDETYMKDSASASPLVAVSNGISTKLASGKINREDLIRLLTSQGVGIEYVQMDDAANIENLKMNKLILDDSVLYQNPDGSGDAGTALANYLANSKNSVFTYNDGEFSSLYGLPNAIAGSTGLQLAEQYDNFTASTASIANNYSYSWSELAPFIHSEFVSGQVAVTPGTINESAVRVLDTHASNDAQTWQLQQRLQYVNGHLYLCITNTGDTKVDEVNITLGINKGVKLNLKPSIMAADGDVLVSKPATLTKPEWVTTSAINYGAITIRNLDTYAFIDLGMAVSGPAPAESDLTVSTQKTLIDFEAAPTSLNSVVKTPYGTSVAYSDSHAATEGGVSLMLTATDNRYPGVTLTTYAGDFVGDGIRFWYSAPDASHALSGISLVNESGTVIATLSASDLVGVPAEGWYTINYKQLGLSSAEIESIAGIALRFRYENATSVTWIDDVTVLNPTASSITYPGATNETVPGVDYDISRITANGFTPEITSSGCTIRATSEYPSISIPVDKYTSSITACLTNNNLSLNALLTKYTIVYEDGTSVSTNNYSSIAVGGSYNLIMPQPNLAKKVSRVSIVFRNQGVSTGNVIDLTITSMLYANVPSKPVVNVIREIDSVNPFNYASVKSHYDALTEEQKQFVANSANFVNRFAPTLEVGEQGTYTITNPAELSATLSVNGYTLCESGVLIIPTDSLVGDLTLENALISSNVRKLSNLLSDDMDKTSYAQWQIIDSAHNASTAYSARAFATYSNGFRTVTFYS